ncbi:MAG: hypothetical protein ACPL3P_09110 [Anaerolineales bacterium]
MKPELIVMLTHHDQTVPDALELFQTLQDLPVRCWGFKDIGLPKEQMMRLVHQMKQAGKTTFLEVVSLSEEEGFAGARIAIEAGFDVLMGTVFFPSIGDLMKSSSVKYYPFPGHVYSHPSILDGSIAEIVEHAAYLESQGVDGLDLLTYRYSGDAPKLLQAVVQRVNIPVVSAGSIASFERIQEVRNAHAWGFTIGSAFFEKKFVPQGDFRQNVLAVWEWLQKEE